MKRTYRQVRQPDGTTKFVEVTPSASLPEDLRFDEPFVSPVDGSLIRNKYDLVDHNRRNDCMQSLPGINDDILSRQRENLSRINGREGKEQRIEAIKRAYETL